ncbi:Biotin/lipoate A/B protein ligase family [Euphorbia peplus]|nr:Biotin/lipoate A/B protein ligase family [Euphorbia peplus]
MSILHQAKEMRLPLMNLVKFKGLPILEQLHLEENLLRTSSENWCIINDGTNLPAIVMGLSGKPSELVEIGPVLRDRVPVIRRFTGGGTVIVDDGTIFVTIICNKDDVPGVQPYPRPIMSWSGLLYSDVFRGIGDFQLRENDYVFGDRKFGGNAQSIIKSRWVHHTSFLWEYEAMNMAYLKQPSRAPMYRSGRNHSQFICGMKQLISRSEFIEKTHKALETQFVVEPKSSMEFGALCEEGFAHSTRLLTEQELENARASMI